MPTVTLRVDKATRARIDRIARRKQLSVSEVVRQAVSAWADREESVETPYELVADLLGVVHGGDPDRSSDGGRKFAEHLRRQRKSR